MSHLTRLVFATTLLCAPGYAQTADDAPQISPIPASLVVQQSAATRVGLSGRLEMLSQQIAAAACNAAAGIAREQSTQLLHDASEDFDRIAVALRFGDEALGLIGAETDRSIRTGIRAVREVWNPVQSGIQAASGGPVTPELAQDISQRSASLLERTVVLADLEIQKYADNDTPFSEVLAIDLIGRQRVLVQNVSKNACLALDGDVSAIIEMQASAKVFDGSLLALRDGLGEVGLQPPPTKAIMNELDAVIAEWSTVKPVIERISAGDPLDANERTTLFVAANDLTAMMDSVLRSYERLPHRGS